MANVSKVHGLTVSISELLKNPDQLERDLLIEQIEKLLDEREVLMEDMSGPYSDEEKALGTELVKLNKQIQADMDVLFNEIKLDMKELRQRKESNKTYLNPYGNVKTTDGIYLDSKQ